jgi:hypothetical protein
MMNPAKVIGFLDVAGDRDPTLAFVMVGALLVAVPAYRFVPRRGCPVLQEKFSLPEKKAMDAPLLGGSALFGVGWGLVGFCPGPAIAALGTGLLPVFAFVAAMLVGTALHAKIGGSQAARRPRRALGCSSGIRRCLPGWSPAPPSAGRSTTAGSVVGFSGLAETWSLGSPERSALHLPEDPLRGGYGVELAIVDLVHGLRVLAF